MCDQLVIHVRDAELRKKLLAVPDMTLDKAQEAARQHEATEQHARSMQGSSVNAVSSDRAAVKGDR